MTEISTNCTRVFCAPGRGESFQDSFAKLTWREKVELYYVDFTPAFGRLLFTEQIALFERIIREKFWSQDAILLGRSFGSWIILNTLMRFEPIYPGTVVLVSSVLGFGGTANLQFIAPRGWKFWDEAKERVAPAKRFMLIHAVDDDQCPIKHAQKLSDMWHIDLVTFQDGGHQLVKTSHCEEVSEIIHNLHFEHSNT